MADYNKAMELRALGPRSRGWQADVHRTDDHHRVLTPPGPFPPVGRPAPSRDPSAKAVTRASGCNTSTTARGGLIEKGFDVPDLDTFWAQGELVLPQATDDGGMLRSFRDGPAAHPLPTPSGKVHMSSETVAGSGYADCPGHPAWLPPTEVPDAGIRFISWPTNRRLGCTASSTSVPPVRRASCRPESLHPAPVEGTLPPVRAYEPARAADL